MKTDFSSRSAEEEWEKGPEESEGSGTSLEHDP